MKILVFTGGLGNQLFGYAFYQFLKEKYPNESIYGIYNKRWMKEHNGLEIDKYFDINLPKSPLQIKMLTILLYALKKIGLCKALISMDTRTFSSKTIVNNACKMHINLLPAQKNWISFKEYRLNDKNKAVLSLINNCDSVSIHIRRGDYYSPQYIKKLGGTCPISYYNQAINYIKSKNPKVTFFVFSDDMSWVKKNLLIPSPIYIDWNNGKDSYIDMFLMSNCLYAIIANSTFSYWGATLGRKKEIIVYPAKWVNEPYTAPCIFPNHWIAF